jgi:hypothetical protein
LGIREEIERFEGVDTYKEPGYHNDGTFQFNRDYRNNPRHTTWTTTMTGGRDLLEGKGHLTLDYRYAVTHTDSTTDVDSLNAAGARHVGEHSLNYNVAEHAGRAHSQRTGIRLDYSPSEWMRIWTVAAFLTGKSVGTSMRGEEGAEAATSGAGASDQNPATVEEYWTSKAINREMGFTEELGVELSLMPKTRLAFDVTLDQNRAKYDWNADVTGPCTTSGVTGCTGGNEGDWAWLSTWQEHRNRYSVSLRSWAIQGLNLWARYRYRTDTTDVTNKLDVANKKPGDPEYEATIDTAFYYPGRIGDNRRGTHEVMLAPSLKVSPRWTLNPKYAFRTSHYEVSGEPDPEVSSFRSNTVAVGVMGQPTDATTVAVEVSRQFALTYTQAKSFTKSLFKNPNTGAADTTYYGGLTPEFDASYTAANSELSYRWRGMRLSTVGGLVDGNGDFDTTLAFAGLGVEGPIRRVEGATWETFYRFYDYHEDENGGINDYTAHGLYVMVRMPFEFTAQ